MPMPHSRDRTDWVHRGTWTLLLLCSLGLFASSVYRAATLPFNHDESLSYAILTWGPGWRASANHHWLNTTMMHWCSVVFGDTELSLRAPNLLAHGVYLLCTLSFIRRLQEPTLELAGFALLNLNLFVNEYFFVARGYGLALAFECVSLYLLVRAYEDRQQPGLEWGVYFSIAAGALAVLANFAFLNFFLALVLVGTWLLLTEGSLRRFSRRHLAATLALLVVTGLFLKVVLSHLFKLQRIGQLYLGGRDGFVADTLQSLMRCMLPASMYSPAVSRTASGILVALFLLLLVLGLRQLIVSPRQATLGVLALILGLAAGLPMLEHRLFGTLFPVERGGLSYVPLYAFTLLSAFSAMRSDPGRAWGKYVIPTLTTSMAVFLGWYFARGFGERSSCAWWEDGHNREVLERISRDRAQRSPAHSVRLRATWVLEPSLNFYRVTRGYSWLMPITREPLTRADADYIYAYERELDTLTGDRDTRLASYPDIHTVLLRVTRGDEP
jgi:hypothetical protein